MSSPAPENLSKHKLSGRSTIKRLPTQAFDCATENASIEAAIHRDGQVSLKWFISMDLPIDREPRLEEFRKKEISDLRSLSETAQREEVRRAAAALHRYARGLTMSSAVEPTPYGLGWLRGLREAFEDGGIEALREREYRPPR